MNLVKLNKTIEDFKNKYPRVPTKINMKKSYAKELVKYCSSYMVSEEDEEPKDIGKGFVGNYTGIPIYVDDSINEDFEVVFNINKTL